jgi:hypothetical protein
MPNVGKPSRAITTIVSYIERWSKMNLCEFLIKSSNK